MGLIDKLVAIGEGFRSSRGTTQKYTLDEMAVMAAEPVGGVGDDNKTGVEIIEHDGYGAPKEVKIYGCGSNDGTFWVPPYMFYTAGYSSGEWGYELRKVTIDDKVSKIGHYAFYKCSKLKTVIFPADLISIENNVFYNCTTLVITEIPESVKEVAESAFYNCLGLTDITFKGTPQTISSTAFKNCTKLLTINVPWAEGEVSGAPWGATNATIHYNYTGG